MLIARGQLNKQKTNQLLRAHLSPHHQAGGPRPSAPGHEDGHRLTPRWRWSSRNFSHHHHAVMHVTRALNTLCLWAFICYITNSDMKCEDEKMCHELLHLNAVCGLLLACWCCLVTCHPNRHHIAKRPHILLHRKGGVRFYSVTDLSIF